MSAYITRYCQNHGEWDEDVDNPSNCPGCDKNIKTLDTKGASEVPYGIKNRNHWWHVDGLGEEQRLNQWAYKIGAEWWASKLNSAYAEGVKAERERCYAITSRDVEVVDNVSGSSFMCKPNCSCAKDIMAGT